MTDFLQKSGHTIAYNIVTLLKGTGTHIVDLVELDLRLFRFLNAHNYFGIPCKCEGLFHIKPDDLSQDFAPKFHQLSVQLTVEHRQLRALFYIAGVFRVNPALPDALRVFATPDTVAPARTKFGVKLLLFGALIPATLFAAACWQLAKRF